MFAKRKEEENMNINKDSQAFGLSNWVSVGAFTKNKKDGEPHIQGEKSWIPLECLEFDTYSYLRGDAKEAIGYMSLDFRDRQTFGSLSVWI